ncbi:hypothetical protein, partial [Acinetobacter stercoris]|uniref:hypothetical protein n=1 Tax=Acinetobacter stercoris TaxID=2126983 RepID=UPI00148CC670
TRTSENISPSGKKYILQQKFQEISPEKLLYIPNSSTQETLQYNNEVCKAINGIDASDKGVRIIQKNTTSVLVCNDIKKSKTEIDKILSQRQACNIQSISYSNYNGITGANNPIAGDILYQNATGSLLRRIEVGGYYNEAIDNLNNESGYSRIFLTVYIGSPGTYPFYTIGRLGCTSTSQGVLVTT